MFQNKQRPCRRFNGTYLEQIRAGQHKTAKAKQQSKNTKSRKTAEAIEIVFTIGDKDNTGYAEAFVEAKCAEEILGDFCDHLLGQSNLCTVTTKELEDPNWGPPFKNGLIVVNLTVHADEATPGVHLTCIPYSCDCKRGPAVQASMGRALAGMGYPSTWKDSLDESGSRIPKRNKNGDIVYNLDGSIRYKQEPDKQGILDWIEEQKQWIQKEMKRRYDWDREYKGSHATGALQFSYTFRYPLILLIYERTARNLGACPRLRAVLDFFCYFHTALKGEDRSAGVDRHMIHSCQPKVCIKGNRHRLGLLHRGNECAQPIVVLFSPLSFRF